MADEKKPDTGAAIPGADPARGQPKPVKVPTQAEADAALKAFLVAEGVEPAPAPKAPSPVSWDDWDFFNDRFQQSIEDAFPSWDAAGKRIAEAGVEASRQPVAEAVQQAREAEARAAQEGAAAAEARAAAAEARAAEAEARAAEAEARAAQKAEARNEDPDTTKSAQPVTGGEQQKQQKQPAAQRPPVVLFEDVTKTFAVGTRREFTAIKDVSFTVEDLPKKGEFICVLGPSGCGKSTVLRLIAGLEPQHPPTRGRVEVFGQTVAGPAADRGMVFQSYTSFDHRTVLGNLVFGLECRGVGRKEREDLAREWIAKVGLSVNRDAQKYPHQLSGGMQQRVAIARTLILKPKIILMDEPFGALDPVTRLKMQDLLVDLWREVEATVFFVTHSIEEAVYLGDRVYIFSNSPGTILREMAVPPPSKPAMEMQRDPEFQDVVFELREVIDRLEREGKVTAEA